MLCRLTHPPLAEVSNPQIEAGAVAVFNFQLAQLAQLAHVLETEQHEQVREQVDKNRFTSPLASCYIASVTPVKRDRDWSPETIAATKAAVSVHGLRLCRSCPLLWRLDGQAQAWPVSRKRLSGRPTHRAAAPIGLGAVVSANHNRLEAIMATSFNALTSEPVSPTTGTPDPIQLHADAHNALNMAVFYLRQPCPDAAAARRKAIQALTALRGLSIALEG